MGLGLKALGGELVPLKMPGLGRWRLQKRNRMLAFGGLAANNGAGVIQQGVPAQIGPGVMRHGA